MPLNGYSVGRDVSLDIVTPNGVLRVSRVTKFTSKQETTEQKVKRMDGITDPVRFFDGWSGSMDVERQDSTLDDYFALLEANYYAGFNEPPCSITETITEVSGSVTQYRYLGVLFRFDDAGDRSGDSTIKQKISFMAQRRMKVA